MGDLGGLCMPYYCEYMKVSGIKNGKKVGETNAASVVALPISLKICLSITAIEAGSPFVYSVWPWREGFAWFVHECQHKSMLRRREEDLRIITPQRSKRACHHRPDPARSQRREVQAQSRRHTPAPKPAHLWPGRRHRSLLRHQGHRFASDSSAPGVAEVGVKRKVWASARIEKQRQ